jgi:hypothetical protein
MSESDPAERHQHTAGCSAVFMVPWRDASQNCSHRAAVDTGRLAGWLSDRNEAIVLCRDVPTRRRRATRPDLGSPDVRAEEIALIGTVKKLHVRTKSERSWQEADGGCCVGRSVDHGILDR